MKKLLTYIAIALLCAQLSAKTTGYMLRDNGSLRVDNGQGGAEWSAYVPAGTKLTVESEEPVVLSLVIKGQDDIENIKFYKVTYEKETYYARVSEVALGDNLTIINADTTLFRKPSLSSFLNARIEQASLVVAGAKTAGTSIEFTEIQYWSESAKEVRRRYVFSDKVSGNKKDLEAIRLVEAAVAIKNKDPAKERAMKLELFKDAMKLDLSSEISLYVHNEYDRLFGAQDIDPFYGHIVSDDGSNVNVRNGPVDGAVAGKLAPGRGILVSKKSVEKSTAEGVEDYWYYVDELAGMADDAVSGWVFGKFVGFDIDAKEADARAAGTSSSADEAQAPETAPLSE